MCGSLIAGCRLHENQPSDENPLLPSRPLASLVSALPKAAQEVQFKLPEEKLICNIELHGTS